MNTIIYLYHGREHEKFIAEKWQESDYCLIKLGLPTLLWKGMKAESNEAGNTKPESDERRKLWEELKDWQVALLLLGGNPYWTYCVYEDYLRERICADIWNRHWVIPEFEEYHESMWVEKLIPHTIPGHYMILGTADCLPRLLCENVKKMRSVKWFLKKEQYTSELQSFIEDFYEEYGLAVEVHMVEDWIRVRPGSPVPVNILDFTGEEKLSACDVAAGSIWLDMDSVDGKNRRIEVGSPQISYFSLKKQWKQRQKEVYHLDTLNKNRYNT